MNIQIRKFYEAQDSGGYTDPYETIKRLNNIIEIKEKERQDWAEMCIKKQARIEELESIPSSSAMEEALRERIIESITNNLYNIRDNSQRPMLNIDKCVEIAEIIYEDIKPLSAPVSEEGDSKK